ncbi:MAG: glycosyltransferase family 4 protein [Ghiorsea sp.]
MRIAYVSQFSEMVGGGEHSLLDLMANLVKTDKPILLMPIQGALAKKAEQAGIPVCFAPMPKLGLATFFALWTWVKVLKQLKPDLIHANQSRAAFYAGLVGQWLGIPVIFHCRIAEPDGLMDKLLMRLVDMVICNSHAVSHRFENAKFPVHVVYNGLHLEPLVSPDKKQLPEAERLLLFVGRISKEKQVNVLLEVFATLAGDDEALHLAIVGGDDPHDGEYAKELRIWSGSQKWGHRVHWLGSQTNVSAWYAEADLLLLTSQHEGFGRVLVEAMAQQLPVVSFAVGGVPEVFSHEVEGLLVKPNDVQVMAKACRKLLDNDELRASMGENGLKRAQTFTISEHVQHIKQCYQQLLDKEK